MNIDPIKKQDRKSVAKNKITVSYAKMPIFNNVKQANYLTNVLQANGVWLF